MIQFMKFLMFYETCAFMLSDHDIMFYKMLLDRFIDFVFLYTVVDVPRQIRTVFLYECFCAVFCQQRLS